ncbi:daunorubicin resistance protein DrrA family ABC transporter ATP-binding protein [Dactylosporangium darangshiense]|uniref:Daunorubicin resistance protein DrrA family ABC transporter ATP-binding protein n=2 Tax=Dactylosporangium darangshiense TaxID=579108 RepID=A0ABP8D8Q9_9ACTN
MSAGTGTVVVMTNGEDLMVEATGLVKTFGTTRALQGVDIAIPRGTVHGVLGPNGAGKTTAVRILSTLLKPDAGQARIGGYDVVRNAERVRASIGLTGQYASVDEDLTGRQNLVLFGTLLDLGRRGARARAAELLAWFDLTEAADRPAKTYSGGMRRRLDLAASLVGRPDVIFLDEPTTGLDPAKREDMWGVVRSLVRDGSTVLLTTQYLEEAEALADEITVIDHGRVIANDTPQRLKRRVGGQTLEVRPSDEADLERTAKILTLVSSGGQPDRPRPGVLAVPVSGDAAMAEAVARLTGEGIAVTELSLHLPSLDEVFFSLTSAKVSAQTAQEVSA